MIECDAFHHLWPGAALNIPHSGLGFADVEYIPPSKRTLFWLAVPPWVWFCGTIGCWRFSPLFSNDKSVWAFILFIAASIAVLYLVI